MLLLLLEAMNSAEWLYEWKILLWRRFHKSIPYINSRNCMSRKSAFIQNYFINQGHCYWIDWWNVRWFKTTVKSCIKILTFFFSYRWDCWHNWNSTAYSLHQGLLIVNFNIYEELIELVFMHDTTTSKNIFVK